MIRECTEQAKAGSCGCEETGSAETQITFRVICSGIRGPRCVASKVGEVGERRQGGCGGRWGHVFFVVYCRVVFVVPVCAGCGNAAPSRENSRDTEPCLGQPAAHHHRLSCCRCWVSDLTGRRASVDTIEQQIIIIISDTTTLPPDIAPRSGPDSR